MKMMLVCVKIILGRKQVGFELPLLGYKTVGYKVRSIEGQPAFLTCNSHVILAFSSEYYDRYLVIIDQYNLFIHSFLKYLLYARH